MLKTFLLFLFPVVAFSSVYAISANDDSEIFTPNKTSATLLINYAEKLKQEAQPGDKKVAEERYLLIYDVYIKARGYAILNKIFFWFSIVAGIAVLLWPSLSVIFKDNLNKWEWIKSATVQTTVTAIAALMFAFYTQYKDKQTYAETLMRYVLYSHDPVSSLSVKVTEELARIDRGFSFNSIINGNGTVKTIPDENPAFKTVHVDTIPGVLPIKRP